MSLQPSTLPDAWKTKRFLSNWRWSTLSENLVIWSSCSSAAHWGCLSWVYFFLYTLNHCKIWPGAGGRPVMAQSADVTLGFVVVEEMEVWEQPCITAPANVLQYFSLARPATAKRVDFCSLENVCACKRHRQWNITENKNSSCFQADWWMMLTSSVPFTTFRWG